MKHRIFGRKLKRTTKERKALFKSLISSLVLKGKIKTTEAKAKAIVGQVDKFVGVAKKGTLSGRRHLLAFFPKKTVGKLLSEVAPSFSSRLSGFTQIIKIGPRKGDNAPMVLLQWVGREPQEEAPKEKVEKEPPKKKRGRKKVVNKKPVTTETRKKK